MTETEQPKHRPYSLHGHVLRRLEGDHGNTGRPRKVKLWELPASHPHPQLHKITVKLT